MPKRKSAILKVAISLGLTALLLYLFLHNMDFQKAAEAVRGTRLGWLATAFLISLAVIPFRSWRWTLLLRGVGTVSQRDALSATCIGFAATTLLPARAGEIVRPLALSRSAKLPAMPLISSVALERLLDLGCAVTLFVVYAIGWAPAHLAGDAGVNFLRLRKTAFLFGAGTFVVLLAIAFFATRPALFARVFRPLVARVPEKLAERIAGILTSFSSGLSSLKSAADIARIGTISLGLWLVIVFQLYATLRAFHLDFPYPVSFFVLAWAILGLAIPTPGGVGGYHTAVAYSLTGFYAVATDTAKAFALVSHALSFIPVTLVGLAFLATSGLSLGRLSEEVPEEPLLVAAKAPGGSPGTP